MTENSTQWEVSAMPRVEELAQNNMFTHLIMVFHTGNHVYVQYLEFCLLTRSKST